MIDHHKLRKIRNDKQWTQGHAAQKIGIQQSYLSKLENDQAIPSHDILQSICNAYECSLEDIAPFFKEPTPLEPTTISSPSNALFLPMKLFIPSIIGVILGLILIAIAQLGIFKSNTAYTYELIETSDVSLAAPNFYISDEYQGEKFNLEILQQNADYRLIGERDIYPKANRIITFFGILLFILSAALLIYCWLVKNKLRKK